MEFDDKRISIIMTYKIHSRSSYSILITPRWIIELKLNLLWTFFIEGKSSLKNNRNMENDHEELWI